MKSTWDQSAGKEPDNAALERLRHDWEELAEADPLWAVLTDRKRKGGRWSVAEFFATGEAEIAYVLDRAASLGVPRGRRRALDFGCGVGRLTRALSARFVECIGVDISETMLGFARKLNADRPNIRFVTNVSVDLRQFPSKSVDLIYSSLVLQHIPRQSIVFSYIGEFLRLLDNGGVAVFQMPMQIPWNKRPLVRRHLYPILRSLGMEQKFLILSARVNPMDMRAVSESRIRQVVAEHGGLVFACEPDHLQIAGLRYYVGRAAANQDVE